MEKKRSVGITIFGIMNCIFGLSFLIGTTILFIFVGILSFTSDSLPKNSSDYLINFLLPRISVIIYYLSSATLLCSGILILLRHPKGRISSIISSLLIIALDLSTSLTNKSFISLISSGFGYWELLFHKESAFLSFLYKSNSLFYGFICYAILLVFYFTRPKVKEQFKS